MILQLSETLEVPLRDRNDWLTAAGFEDAALVPVLPLEMAKGGVRMFFLGDRDRWYGAGRHRR